MSNQLKNETSPYLQQHAENPVDWYPWNNTALALARQQDKPILLSIGYSACHWCHVMAHESFESESIAKLMNQYFVNIKVDREERPDLDKIYQLAHAAMTRRGGGWPLTMFLTPDKHLPFFGGTYFPDKARHGMPSFAMILQRVADFFKTNRADVNAQGTAMQEFFDSLHSNKNPTNRFNNELSDQAQGELESLFDNQYGGFGQAPKFPHPTNIERSLRYWQYNTQQGSPKPRALHLARFTLEKMAYGGIYDHLGGGFCRYSVDGQWMIPHFEKMLYDNGPLLALYADAWTITDDPLFAARATQTAQWVMREMQSVEGGYFCTLDADSEGEEGKYYAWQRETIQRILSTDEYHVFAAAFHIEGPANFEEKWHLHQHRTAADIASDHGISLDKVEQLLERAKSKLFEARNERIRPGLDDKVLTGWNALMISGMARTSRRFRNLEHRDSLERALNFIRDTLWDEPQLYASYKDGKAHLSAYLDDYAFLLEALLEVLQLRWSTKDLNWAIALADALLERFEDQHHGGFYFTSHSHESLIHRPKAFADEATPSGNAVAALALNRLGHLTGDIRYLKSSSRAIEIAVDDITRAAAAHATSINAMEEILNPPAIAIIRAQPKALTRWLQLANKHYAPNRLVFGITLEQEDLPKYLKIRAPQGEHVAYFCHGNQCSPPITTEAAFISALSENKF